MVEANRKQQFLQRITERLNRPRPRQVTPPDLAPWDNHSEETKADRVGRFSEEAEQAGAEVRMVRDEQSLRKLIDSDLKKDGFKKVLTWKETAPLLEGTEGIQVCIWEPDRDRMAQLREAEQSDVGLVRAEWGLAFTGTLVLWNDEKRGRGRAVSLLPPVLYVVLDADHIASRMFPVLKKIENKNKMVSCLNFITGPSRTSDIENDLSLGVHGPGRVQIYVVEKAGV
ncbi:LutC/YkgG family protein [Melghirimyces algeriensis]|uniref:L-lactate dehydrogenase complex protein LldG n=1 Tax=Melghirimyces algeriensis TaxID=910412 RepID=A0A521AJT9_9BACL|nr:lactate utilization protein C [Melghirimyces algeriensis]SMO34940.1 L-lactate dehydrogenase complex protein LldG [Melghirimyces algeriensis]